MIGRKIGPYRLEEEIGRGGMGAVYRASRADGEFEQTVAVKLIKRGMDTDMILRRFRRERQILAGLNHPNIGYFLGGGSTEDGLPYFVMEYIDGLPLYKYCNSESLTVRRRLEVFRQVCWAVAAAHEKQVVHRDLKPSNILVKRGGKPKLLDFGIAKVLDPDLSYTDGDPTATQMRAMTPDYASPEQIGGGEVGPRSDIYSLGVILYELLTGHRPYVLHRRANGEDARVIREEVPTYPSGSVTLEGGLVPDNGAEMTLDGVFTARGMTADELRRELAGDLDRIVMKALRKRPEERYASATEFADDISSFLEGRPVKAEYFVSMANISAPREPDKRSIAILPFKVMSEPGAGEGTAEFVGVGMADALISRLSTVQRLVIRPTTSVLPFGGADASEAAAGLGVDHVLDGTVRMIGGRIRVSVQLYDAALGSIRWARAFDKEIGDVLEVEDAIAAQVSVALIPELTSEERDRIERRGTNRPEAYGAYMRGRFQWSRFTDDGLKRSVEEFRRAIEIDPDYALPYLGLADYYMWAAIFGEIPSTEGFPKAQEAARKALEIDDSLGEAYAIFAFAVLFYDWNFEEAEALARKAIEYSPNSAFARECYSNFLTSQGRFDEGIAEIRKAEELDPVSPRAILMTSWTLYHARRFREAEAKARKALSMQEGLPQGCLHLGNILIHTAKMDEAVAVLRRSAEGWRGSGMPRYLLAFARAGQGDAAAVGKLLTRLKEAERDAYMKPYFIAMAYVAAGDHERAFEYFRRAVDERNEWMIWFATDPKLDPVRDDPRYRELLRRTGNPIADRSGVDTGPQPSTSERERSIAVLPFQLVSSSDDASDDSSYLSLGLADALTMRLSNVRKFIVRPTSSVLQYMDRRTDPIACGHELGVEFVVDGIIRRVGNTIRVTAQLLDVSENSTRWSSSFSEPFNDVLELEDSISEQVTRLLLPKLSSAEEQIVAKRGTDNPDAHDAYLQGRYFWNQLRPEAFAKSLAAFERAVELDPNYAHAFAGICDFYTWAVIYGLISPLEANPRVLRAAEKALSLDENLAEAHAVLGLYYSNAQRWADSERSYRRAIELNPGYAQSHEWLSAVLVGTGRFDEGLRSLQTAEELNPIALRQKVITAWTAYQARRFDHALDKSRELERMDQEFMQSNLQLANVLMEIGQPEEAVKYSQKAVELEPDSPLPLYIHCFALVRTGRTDEAASILGRWEEVSRRTYVPPFFLGMANIAIGEIDKGFVYLEAARLEGSAWTIWLGTEPKLDLIRHDARYLKLLKETNNPIVDRFGPGLVVSE